MKIFTLTEGRTGSDWLSKFLSINLNIDTIHEPLGIDDFGLRMPEIKHMRMFNDRGFNDVIRNFWKNKLDVIDQSTYVETNHTLGKCGLIEALSTIDISEKAYVIILNRDPIKQCASYIHRGDFNNITIPWQWYLYPSYKKNLISFNNFQKFGRAALPCWYFYEMKARKIYYKYFYSENINFIEISLEKMNDEKYATNFLNSLNIQAPAKLPPKSNDTKGGVKGDIVNYVSEVFESINFDDDRILKTISKHGKIFQ